MRAIFLIIFIGLVSSCSKKDKKEDDLYQHYDGTVSAIRNGAAWNPRLAAVYDSSSNKKRVSLIFYNIDTEPFDRTTIRNIPSIATSYTIIEYWIWRTSRDIDTLRLPHIYYNGSFNEGEDVLNSPYLSSDVTPFILIESYDTIANIVKGKMEASFRRWDKPASNGIDSVVYRNVRFSAPIHTYAEFNNIK